MKVWIKYLLGVILGIIAYFILPMNIPAVSLAVENCSEFAIRFGRYSLMPILFFGTTYAVFKLRSQKLLLKASFWTGLAIVFSTVILIFLGLFSLGVISFFDVNLPRIPITGERMAETPTINVKELIMNLVPYSSFDSLKNGVYLLPVFLFAGFAGAGCAVDTVSSKPVINLLESLAKLCYTLSSFIVEWIAVGMIAISSYWLISLKAFTEAKIFMPMTTLLLVDLLLFIFLICPILIKIFCKDSRPYRVLYAAISPLLAAFFSRDTNFVLQVNMRHGKESLGINDSLNHYSYPLFAIFGRGGTALVITVCFVTILRSYSPLAFSMSNLTWLFLSAFGVSFILCALPAGGTFVALAVLCTMYGKGFESGYILMRPAIPVLASFACAFDAAAAAYGSYFTAMKCKMIEHVELRHFI